MRRAGHLEPCLLFIGVCLAVAIPAQAGNKVRLQIKPGEMQISKAEADIESDPAAGIEHGVILLEETEVDESELDARRVTFHLRAKILSNEGRSLADVEIPLHKRRTKLKRWWGRTIQPDGTVMELKKSELEEQFVLSARKLEVRTLKAALPGVVPGCVIDYGYVLREDRLEPYRRVFLQRPWPVESFRFRWQPSAWLRGAYVVTSSVSDLQVDVRRDQSAVLIMGTDLPSLPEEPWMPPRHLLTAQVIFYYPDQQIPLETFWKTQGALLEEALELYLKSEENAKIVDDAVSAVSGGGSRVGRLKAAYEWFQSEKAPDRPDFELDMIFVGVARKLDTHAHLVLATDRRVWSWNRELRLMNQFSDALVIISLDGRFNAGAFFLDPGSVLSFGDVPWWLTGGEALIGTLAGGLSVKVTSSPASNNVARTEAQASVSDDGETIQSSWVLSGQGQVGLQEMLALEEMTEDSSKDERQDYLKSLCGSGPEVEILGASMSEEHLAYELSCEAEALNLEPLDPDVEVIRFPLSGPWLPKIPDLPGGNRVHDVVFDFPHIDIVRLKISTPNSFEPLSPPPPVRMDSPFGRYARSISVQPDGYLVERTFELTEVRVTATDYSALARFLGEARQHDAIMLEFRRGGNAP